MSTHKKLTFTNINKQKDLILINSMKELKNAFNKKQQIIALGKKSKVIDPGNDNNHHNNKVPKYFTDFVKEQREFNSLVLAFIQEQRKNWEEQRKFNKYVLDMFKKHKWIK